jgi:disulfide bond formation protein DsbB
MIPSVVFNQVAGVEIFERIGASRLYWLAMIVIALAAEGVALYYQYALNQYPCVLCIHVRLWVAAFVIVGALGLAMRTSRRGRIAASALSLVAAIGFTERSWQTLATERGWIVELACPMDAGLPSWFDLDHWFPAVFGVQASCGISPEMLFGISMAEALMAMSVVTLCITSLVLAANVIRSRNA